MLADQTIMQNVMFVVAHASQYSSYEVECLAAVWAIAHFWCYLYGNEFLLVTHHQPLKWFIESDKLTGKLARWALLLQEYDFKVVHRARLVNMDVDGLSRPHRKDEICRERMSGPGQQARRSSTPRARVWIGPHC